MLPECWRADPDIHCHIEDRASHDAHELALSMRRRLKMQTADGAGFRREYVIVLNELYRHAPCDQCLAIVGLGEKAPPVAMNSRSHELDVGDMQRPYFQDKSSCQVRQDTLTPAVPQSGTGANSRQVRIGKAKTNVKNRVTIARRLASVGSSTRAMEMSGMPVDAKTTTDQTKSLVVGGTGLVGGYIVQHLVGRGERPMVLSRSEQQGRPDIHWVVGDLKQPDTLNLPPFATLYCSAYAALLANALPRLLHHSLSRVIAFSSTSVITKQESEIAAEREIVRQLADAERSIASECEQRNVGWTILRPTLIYAEGRDSNITPLSRLIRRFGFMPLVGGAQGLRQPVHAEDLAVAAIAAAASPAAVNNTYVLPGAETLAYREMVGRIFDGLGRPRRTISVPSFLWRAG